MPGEKNNSMQCAEFDGLLSDAIEGSLSGERLEQFQAHARVCASCGPLFAEADAGRRWLKSLEEVDPPVNLVHNILVATSGRESRLSNAQAPRSWKDFLRPIFVPVVAMARQPRFAMSFGMVFFSMSITMSLAGVKFTDLSHLDLRPSAVRRSYYENKGRVVKYYENIRFVYEVESRVRELKRVTAPTQPEPETKDKTNKNNTSGQPDQNKERNYSQWEGQPVLACYPNQPPVAMGTTYRRNS
jgi:Putative zinc-finger